MDDTVLIEAARSGDLAAFSDLVRRHQALVRAALAVRMSCPHEAEDLAQEAFVTAFRKLEVFATGFFEAACVRTRASGQYRVVGGRIAEDRARADLQPPAIRKKETMSAPSKACDMQSVKVRHGESLAGTLLPNVQTGRQRTG